MINTKLFVYLVVYFMFVSCKGSGSTLVFANCHLAIPSSFERVTNTLAIEEFTKFAGTDISIIQLSEADKEFEDSLKSDDFNSVEFFKYKDQVLYKYNFNVKNFNINNITIVADDRQLNFQGLNHSDLVDILSNCYGKRLLETLIAN